MATMNPSEEDPSPPSAPSSRSPLLNPTILSAVYDQLSTYPFFSDQEFLSGLAAILGHPDVPATPVELRTNEDLVLQARCFYLSRKLGLEEPIEPERYLEWSRARGQNSSVESSAATTKSIATTQTITPQPTPPPPAPPEPLSQPPSSPPISTTQDLEPPYPPSFAQIVDLITRNLPIPGIEEIPPTVLEPGTSKVDRTPRRKKPWEQDSLAVENKETNPEAERVAGNSGREREEKEECGTRRIIEDSDTQGTETAGAVKAGAQSVQDIKGTNLNGHISSSDGVVKILQPNAIPDNGLLSRD